MKLSELKSIVKEAVKEAIQEEMKDILLEAVRSPRQTVVKRISSPPSTGVGVLNPLNPVMQQPLPETDRMAMRENIQSVLGSMMPGADGTLRATTNSMPLQMSGNMDTTSPNGSLPAGEVDMNMIMGLMKSK